MAWERVDIGMETRRQRSVGKRPGATRLRRGRLFGWLAAASLLAHGWLPIVLQTSLAGSDGADHDGRHSPAVHGAAVAAPDLSRSRSGQECPIFHDPICLCAIFTSFLMPAGGEVPAPGVMRGARRRYPTRGSRRTRPAAAFKARAPPRLP